MAIVLLLGAGASKGTLGECAPTSSEFGKQLRKTRPNWTEEYPYLKAAIQFLEERLADTSLESWALDEVWGAMATRDRLKRVLTERPDAPTPPAGWDFWGVASFELSLAVARVYGERLEDKIKQAVERNDVSVKTEIEHLNEGDCIFSLNYDLLAERILDKVNPNWTRAVPWYEPCTQTAKILLCKPHGSLDWKGYFPGYGHPVEFLDGAMKDREITPKCHPCLVAPILFKSEIIDWSLQLDLAPDLFHLLVAQWGFAIDYISKADKFVVMGYGFPSEDSYAHYMFAEAAAKRKRKKLQIEVYETCEQRFDEVKREIDKIFSPSGCSCCEYKGAVKG